MFTGLSSLRKPEKKEPTERDKQLQAYLASKYGGPADDAPVASKKKKKKKPKGSIPSAVKILEGDITGFADVADTVALPLKREEEQDDEEDEPIIANPEEAEAFKTQIEKSKNFYQAAADGSGWVATNEQQQQQRRRQQRQRHDSPANSSSDRDMSPPRRGRHRHDSPVAAERAAAAARGRKRSLSPQGRGDLSPPRRGRQRHDSPVPAAANGGGGQEDRADLSPPRRRHGSADLSPPRRTRQRHDSPAAAAAATYGTDRGGTSDLSPPRRRGRSADLSPPRRGRQRHDSPPPPPAAAGSGDLSPPRRARQRHDSPPDESPPRRRQRHDSPPQAAAAGDRDLSPPRRGKQRHDSPVAAPRRGRHDSPAAAAAAKGRDLSPPRLRRHDSPDAAAAAAQGPMRMGDGTAAGLVSHADLAAQNELKRAHAEERRRNAVGKGEATVYRDKVTGKVITAEEYTAQQAKAKQKKAPPEEIHVAWKGGLAQQRAAVEAAQRAATEAAKAFGRGFDDDADAELRDRSRWGDPMAGKLKRQQLGGDQFELPAPVITEANRAMMEASGFVVPQAVPPHSWLRRGVAAPTNRYNLRPGRHWDGVDRSNGFEKEMFKTLNQKAAQELEARMWAQEDM